MKSFSYYPFVASFCSIIGIGFVASILWMQRGGLVSNVQQLERLPIPQTIQTQNTSYTTTENLPTYIEVPEVKIIGSSQNRITHHKKIYQCREHFLQQGGRIEQPTVDVCEWK